MCHRVSRSKFLLLTRDGCELCGEFEQELWTCAGLGGIELEHADVDSRPDWQRRYGLRIPVLLDTYGEVVCATFFDVVAFRAAIGKVMTPDAA